MLILINSFTLVQLVVTQYFCLNRATHHTHRCILSTESNKNICHYREAFMKIELPVGGFHSNCHPLSFGNFSHLPWGRLASSDSSSASSRGSSRGSGCLATLPGFFRSTAAVTPEIFEIIGQIVCDETCVILYQFVPCCAILCYISYHFFLFGGISLSVPFCVICQFWAPWKFSLSFAYMRISFAWHKTCLARWRLI